MEVSASSKKKNANLRKFEDKADEGIFLGYSTKSRGYKCYNKNLKKIVESTDVKVAEHGVYASDDGSNVEDNEIDESQMQEQNDVSPEFVKQSAADDSSSKIDIRPRNTVFHKDHPRDQIIGDPNAGVQTCKMKSVYSLLSQVEPKNVAEAAKDESWVKAMNEELDQIEKNQT